jgi:putative cardiolipin synthase
VRLLHSTASSCATRAVLLLALVLAACAAVPPGADFPRPPSRALANPGETKLGALAAKWSSQHDGLTGFRLLPGGIDSFSLRAEMADAAQRTIDAQYFVLQGDDTGRLFIGRLLAAADRGVRVRLLLDDANSIGGDRRVTALAAHPNIEVRMFNPFRIGGGFQPLRAVDLALEAPRVSRRMHNKLLAIDNAIAVAGGRNIGDEYFKGNRAFEFGDFDVFAAGPAVQRLEHSFDAYWNSDLSIPAQALDKIDQSALEAYRDELKEHQAKMAESDYERHTREGDPLKTIVDGTKPLVFAPSRVLYDSPDKAKPGADDEFDAAHVTRRLEEACRATQHELTIVTPYLVPGAEQMAMLRELRQRNVRVRILTNSLASTDVPLVHAGYRKRRLPLVEMGVELFEVKPQLDAPQVGHQRLVSDPDGRFSLHAKVFVFDRQRVFVGSENFDMRSFNLNTEIGIIIDSPELARQAIERFEAITIPANSYAVKLAETRLGEPSVHWITEQDGKRVELDHEPGGVFWRELLVGAVSILPIDGQL